MQPETIGSIAYLSKFYKQLKKRLICGFNLSCVGDNKAFSLIHTPKENTLADIALSSALSCLKNVKEYSFLSRGSDERQYCSPRVNLPVCTFCRSKFGEFKEYHTSADNFNLVTQEGLNASLEVLISLVDAFEVGIYPKSLIMCEPQLGKRAPISQYFKTYKVHPAKLRTDFIAYCDGERTIFEICKKINCDLRSLIKESKLLRDEKLISIHRKPN